MKDLSTRRSIRLNEYDYSQPGAYFVTICTRGRECLLGDIADGEMRLNDAGRMVKVVWDELPSRFLGLQSDAFVVMPNHVHGMIIFVGAQFIVPDSQKDISNRVYTLGDIVRMYKATVTRLVRLRNNSVADQAVMKAGVMNHAPTGTARFGWQRNYYEHVIRNDDDLQRTREYIIGNPALWDKDENNPALLKTER